MKRFGLRTLLFSLLALSGAISLSAKDLGVDDLTVDWSAGTSADPYAALTLTWDVMDAISTETFTGPVVYYSVYRMAGYQISTNTVVASGTNMGSTDLTTLNGFGGGVYSWVVKGTALPAAGANTDTSPLRYSHFIHHTLAPMSQDIVRLDGGDSQTGMSQRWTFDYKLINDAYMTISIYSGGTTFSTAAATGFITSASLPPIKSIVDNTPRSMQMAGDVFENRDFWDLRNSSGAVVTKGLYYALFTAKSASDGSTIVDTVLKTVPVNTIYLYNISATAITDTVASSNVSFTVNADCRVKVLVCSPGTKFRVATAAGSMTYLTSYTYSYIAGDLVPVDPTTPTTDAPARLLRVLDYNVVGGAQTFAWDGLNAAGAALTSGLYVFGISAADAFGNHAIDLTGNNYAHWSTIAVSRSATQPSPVSVIALFPAPAGTPATAVNRVTAAIAPTMDGVVVDPARTTITLTGPDHRVIAGVQTWNPAANRLDLALPAPLTVPGTYQVDVQARGTVLAHGDFSTSAQSTFVLAPGGGLEGSYVAPSPVKGVDHADFSFSLPADGDVKLTVTDVMGERVLERRASFPAGAHRWPWDLRNDDGASVASGVYFYELDALGQRVRKKFIVIK